MQKDIDLFINLQLADNTKKTYRGILKRFSEHFNGELPAEGWELEYLNFLKNNGLCNKSINQHTTVLVKFYQQVLGKKIKFDRLKQRAAQVNYLKMSEAKILLDAAPENFRAVLKFMLDTGVRVSELAWISRQKFTEVPGYFTILGKGDKQRVVIVSEETKELLRKEMGEGLLFGKEYSVVMVQQKLRKLAKRNGLKVHPHMLRHGFAMNMLARGADITDVKTMLGHSYLATTEVYTHVDPERIKATWEKCLERKI